VHNKAVLSPQTAGIRSSLSDLLLFENGEAHGVPMNCGKVSSNVAALNHGLGRLRILSQRTEPILWRHGTLGALSTGLCENWSFPRDYGGAFCGPGTGL
jgi:hypothetical protein